MRQHTFKREKVLIRWDASRQEFAAFIQTQRIPHYDKLIFANVDTGTDERAEAEKCFIDPTIVGDRFVNNSPKTTAVVNGFADVCQQCLVEAGIIRA